MARYTPKKYKDNDYRRPNYNIDPKDKGKKYCIGVAESIYSMYLKDMAGIYYSAISNFEKQRRYGRGEQDEDQYKDFLSESPSTVSGETIAQDTDTGGDFIFNKEARRKGWMNVSWAIFSIMPKIKLALQGNFDGIERDIIATAIDDKSVAEEENAKWRLWIEKEHSEWLDKQRSRLGLPNQEPMFIPGDSKELEIFKASGGFKANHARVIELMTKHTLEESDWDGLKEKVIDDLIDLGIAVVKDYYDEETKRIRIKYCDPLWTIIQYSRHRDFRDSEYGGEITRWSVSKLRSKGFSELVLKSLAEKYGGFLGNPEPSQWVKHEVRDDHGWKYDNYKIPVFELSWIDTDVEHQAFYITKTGGREKTYPLGFNEKPQRGERRRTTSLRNLYKCNWIIDTEYAFDYGMEYDVPRPHPSEPIIPFRAIKTPSESLTKTLMPLLNHLQIAWLKYQNSLAMAKNAGYAIEIGSIENVGLGGGKNDFMKVIKMWRETGDLLYRDQSIIGNRPSAPKPIHEMPGGMGRMLDESIKLFSFNLQLIENLTGISPLALGQTPDPNAPVGTSEMAIAATAKVLKPILKGVFRIKEDVARSALLRIQLAVRYNKDIYEGYQKVISRSDLEILKKAESESVAYGIHLEARGTDKERNALIRAAEIALAAGRDGRAGIDLDTYTYIIERVANKVNLKEIRMYLTYAIKKSKQEIAARANEAALIQDHQTRGLEAMKSKDRLEEHKLETLADAAHQKLVHANKMEQIEKEKQWEYNIKLLDVEKSEKNEVKAD